MSPVRTILVPVDFAPPSEHALAFAVDLAESLGAKVHVISAFELPIAAFPDGVYMESAAFATRLIDHTNAGLEKAFEAHRGRKVEMTKHLEQGEPREVILRVASEIQADLIVMGTHGRTGISRALVGSVAETVIRAALVPVLTVH